MILPPHETERQRPARLEGPKDLGKPKMRNLDLPDLWLAQIFGTFPCPVQGFNALTFHPGNSLHGGEGRGEGERKHKLF